VSRAKSQRWFAGLSALVTCGLLASSSVGAIDPHVPIPGVMCPAGTNQITDTVARVDAVCSISLDKWIEIGGDPDKAPEIATVDPRGMQPKVPTDPDKLQDLIDKLPESDPDGAPPGELGPILDGCQTDPACFMPSDPGDFPPQEPDPDPDITVQDDGNPTPGGSVGYHCDPHIYTTDDLVSLQSVVPVDGGGNPLEPVDAWVLNPNFPAILIPRGDPNVEVPIPGFLSTRDGIDNTTGLAYWLDDPRSDNSAYIDSGAQGCVSIQNTAPPVAPQGVTAELPDPAVNAAVLVKWDLLEQTVANNGGDRLIEYEAQSVPGGFTCTATVESGLTGCLVRGLNTGTAASPGVPAVPGTPYFFRVRVRNSVGWGPLSDASDPAVTPVRVISRSRVRPPKARAAWRTAMDTLVSAARVLDLAPARGHASKAAKITVPGPPQLGKVVQIDSRGSYPLNGAVTVSWTAPKVNGGKPITAYNVVGTQTGRTGIGCTAPDTAPFCQIDGITKNLPITFAITAVNAKGQGAAFKTPAFKFSITCKEWTSQAKCAFKIKVKAIIRVAGTVEGRKLRVGCGLSPFISNTLMTIRNPAFPRDPNAFPTLVLGRAVGPVCRMVLQQVALPALNATQKAQVKAGYLAMAFKIIGLPSKGSRELPVALPYAKVWAQAPIAIAKNGTSGPTNQAVLSDANGVALWIGYVTKAGYYPVNAQWPFYKAGRTSFTFKKTKPQK